MISQAAEYALRAVVCLAQRSGEPLTTYAIAQQTRVPAGYLAKIMQALGRAELVISQRGVNGGFVLSRSGDAITLLDVVSAVDPSRRIAACPLGILEHANNLCALHRKLDEAAASAECVLRSTTIARLLNEPSLAKPLGNSTELEVIP